MKSKAILILEAMDNGQTLSNIELSKIASWRFGGYLYNLRRAGVVFQKTKGKSYIEYWTIINIPENIKYKNRNSLKIIKLDLLERIYNYTTK